MKGGGEAGCGDRKNNITPEVPCARNLRGLYWGSSKKTQSSGLIHRGKKSEGRTKTILHGESEKWGDKGLRTSEVG